MTHLCHRCNGSGENQWGTGMCSLCRGAGEIPEEDDDDFYNDDED